MHIEWPEKNITLKYFEKLFCKYLTASLSFYEFYPQLPRRPATSLKKDCDTGVFLSILNICRKNLFTEYVRPTAFQKNINETTEINL